MSVFTIDLTSHYLLTPQSRDIAPAGYEYLTHVYFRIKTPHYFASLVSCDKAIEEAAQRAVDTAYEEMCSIFTSLGWTPYREFIPHSGICPMFEHGRGSFAYCHPQSISGQFTDEEIAAITTALSTAKCFKHYNTDVYDLRPIVKDNDEEQQFFHAMFDDKITDIISQHTSTKRSNLYRRRSEVIDCIGDNISVNTVNLSQYMYHGDNIANWKYISEHITRLTVEGYIKLVGNGELIRWANKKELKAMNRVG